MRGKEIQYLNRLIGTGAGKWITYDAPIESICLDITNGDEFRVKPEPKTEKRYYYWFNKEDGLQLCCVADRSRANDSSPNFHSWAKPPTVEADGTMTFEVPTE